MAFTTVKEVNSMLEKFIETDPVALEDETISNNTGETLEFCFVTEVTHGKKIVLVPNEALGFITCAPGEDVVITAAQQQEALDQGQHSDIYLLSRGGTIESTLNGFYKVRGGTVIPKTKTKTTKKTTK